MLVWIYTPKQFAQTGSCMSVCASKSLRANENSEFAQTRKLGLNEIAYTKLSSLYKPSYRPQATIYLCKLARTSQFAGVNRCVQVKL